MKKIGEVLAGLFSSASSGASLGRVAFWIVFGLTIFFWMVRPVEAFPPSLEHILMFLLIYNITGKLVYRLGQTKVVTIDHLSKTE